MNQELQKIMNEHPRLTADGYCDDTYVCNWSKCFKKEGALHFENSRETLANYGAQYEAAKGWIAKNMVKRVNFNRKVTSYWLKHVCENHIGYIPNGVFIAAMLGSGFRMATVEGSPNVFFNANLANGAYIE